MLPVTNPGYRQFERYRLTYSLQLYNIKRIGFVQKVLAATGTVVLTLHVRCAVLIACSNVTSYAPPIGSAIEMLPSVTVGLHLH